MHDCWVESEFLNDEKLFPVWIVHLSTIMYISGHGRLRMYHQRTILEETE